MTRGRFIVILLVATAVFVGVASTVVMSQKHDDAYLNQAGIGLRKVHKAATVRARGEDGAYPRHISLLWSNFYFRPSLLRDPRGFDDSVWTVNGVDARPFLEELRDDVPEGERLDRTPLIEAVQSLQPQPYDRFGDYWFVRLDRHRNHPDLIFGWTIPDEEGKRFVVFDSGDPLRVTAEQWPEIWQRDAAARKELGLEPVPVPD